ncbi:hypothetical protein [Methylomicrobium lacus]|uniref:hypothetical protein n=1 Tax=Methylomicrobium lacus TaxID=136992 RepID=UPI0035A99B47
MQLFTLTEENIPSLIEQTISTVVTKGAQVIECKEITQKESNIIILSPDEFFRSLEILRPKCVFLYRGFFDAWEEAKERFSDNSDWDDDDDDDDDAHKLYEKFVELNRDVIERTIQICHDVFYFEIFILIEGHVLSCGYISTMYQLLVKEINSFREKVNEEDELIKSAKREQRRTERDRLMQEHDRLAKELMSDPDFIAIRGKRKRCIYVQNKYGDSLFNSGRFRRPDSHAEYMDSGLVALVEKASDAIDLGIDAAR